MIRSEDVEASFDETVGRRLSTGGITKAQVTGDEIIPFFIHLLAEGIGVSASTVMPFPLEQVVTCSEYL